MPDHDVPRSPFEGVTDYFSEMNRMRQTGAHGREQTLEDRQRTHANAWVPTTDIYASGDDLVIEVELPGVDPDEVNISFAHGVLTVSGHRRPRREQVPDESYYVRERFHGEFRRAVTLPEGTEPGQITAVFDVGLVEITVRGAVGSAEASRIELRHRSEEPTTRSLG
jgi:HSP20 family protein